MLRSSQLGANAFLTDREPPPGASRAVLREPLNNSPPAVQRVDNEASIQRVEIGAIDDSEVTDELGGAGGNPRPADLTRDTYSAHSVGSRPSWWPCRRERIFSQLSLDITRLREGDDFQQATTAHEVVGGTGTANSIEEPAETRLMNGIVPVVGPIKKDLAVGKVHQNKLGTLDALCPPPGTLEQLSTPVLPEPGGQSDRPQLTRSLSVCSEPCLQGLNRRKFCGLLLRRQSKSRFVNLRPVLARNGDEAVFCRNRKELLLFGPQRAAVKLPAAAQPKAPLTRPVQETKFQGGVIWVGASPAGAGAGCERQYVGLSTMRVGNNAMRAEAVTPAPPPRRVNDAASRCMPIRGNSLTYPVGATKGVTTIRHHPNHMAGVEAVEHPVLRQRTYSGPSKPENLEVTMPIDSGYLLQIDCVLRALLQRITPSNHERRLKQDTFNSLTAYLYEHVGNQWKIYVTGSSAYDVDACASDLDVVVTTSSNVNRLEVLQKISQLLNEVALKPGQHRHPLLHVRQQLVESARVPILLLHSVEGVVCDISVNSANSLCHTEFFKRVLDQKPQLRALMRLVKFWVKSRKLPTTREGGLPSIVWMLLCVFTCRQNEVCYSQRQRSTTSEAPDGGADTHWSTTNPGVMDLERFSSAFTHWIWTLNLSPEDTKKVAPYTILLSEFFSRLSSRAELSRTLSVAAGLSIPKSLPDTAQRIVAPPCHGGVWDELLSVEDPAHYDKAYCEDALFVPAEELAARPLQAPGVAANGLPTPGFADLAAKISAATWLLYQFELRRAALIIQQVVRRFETHSAELEAKMREGQFDFEFLVELFGALFEAVPSTRYMVPASLEPCGLRDTLSSDMDGPKSAASKGIKCGILEPGVSERFHFALILLSGKLSIVRVNKICADQNGWWSREFLSRRDIRSVMHGTPYHCITVPQAAKHDLTVTEINRSKLPYGMHRWVLCSSHNFNRVVDWLRDATPSNVPVDLGDYPFIPHGSSSSSQIDSSNLDVFPPPEVDDNLILFNPCNVVCFFETTPIDDVFVELQPEEVYSLTQILDVAQLSPFWFHNAGRHMMLNANGTYPIAELQAPVPYCRHCNARGRDRVADSLGLPHMPVEWPHNLTLELDQPICFDNLQLVQLGFTHPTKRYTTMDLLTRLVFGKLPGTTRQKQPKEPLERKPSVGSRSTNKAAIKDLALTEIYRVLEGGTLEPLEVPSRAIVPPLEDASDEGDGASVPPNYNHFVMSAAHHGALQGGIRPPLPSPLMDVCFPAPHYAVPHQYALEMAPLPTPQLPRAEMPYYIPNPVPNPFGRVAAYPGPGGKVFWPQPMPHIPVAVYEGLAIGRTFDSARVFQHVVGVAVSVVTMPPVVEGMLPVPSGVEGVDYAVTTPVEATGTEAESVLVERIEESTVVTVNPRENSRSKRASFMIVNQSIDSLPPSTSLGSISDSSVQVDQETSPEMRPSDVQSCETQLSETQMTESQQSQVGGSHVVAESPSRTTRNTGMSPVPSSPAALRASSSLSSSQHQGSSSSSIGPATRVPNKQRQDLLRYVPPRQRQPATKLQGRQQSTESEVTGRADSPSSSLQRVDTSSGSGIGRLTASGTVVGSTGSPRSDRVAGNRVSFSLPDEQLGGTRQEFRTLARNCEENTREPLANGRREYESLNFENNRRSGRNEAHIIDRQQPAMTSPRDDIITYQGQGVPRQHGRRNGDNHHYHSNRRNENSSSNNNHHFSGNYRRRRNTPPQNNNYRRNSREENNNLNTATATTFARNKRQQNVGRGEESGPNERHQRRGRNICPAWPTREELTAAGFQT